MYTIEYQNRDGDTELLYNFKSYKAAEAYCRRSGIKWYVISGN